MPKVSVIMSVYNGEKYLKESAESILHQTFPDFEFIIVNDGSTDKTPEILRSFNDERIKVINQENMGLTRSLNKAINLVRGEYVARMDADDVSFPERLEYQVKFLDENPDVGMVGTACKEIDSKGRLIGDCVFPTIDNELRKVLIKYNPFVHASVMIRRTVIDKAGIYDESFSSAQDYEFWFRIAKFYKIANLAQLLLVRRYTTRNISIEKENEQIKNSVNIRRKAIKEGQYPLRCYIYLLRPFLVIITPKSIRWLIRKNFLKSGRIYYFRDGN
ncbi:MAG TPA: glycosyltransferase [Actinobacteria bacterium]|nr:glycosyltransferase [Actinomycetota bacterium]